MLKDFVQAQHCVCNRPPNPFPCFAFKSRGSAPRLHLFISEFLAAAATWLAALVRQHLQVVRSKRMSVEPDLGQFSLG